MSRGEQVPTSATSATSGARVLDMGNTLGSTYCARLLTAGGADVLRAEPLGGSALRRWSASGAHIDDGDNGALFGWLAGGQRAVTVDVSDPADVDALLQTAATMDAIVWSSASPLAGPGGITVAQLSEAAPDAVIIAVTPFGLEGPWADLVATEFTLQAMSGGPAMRGSRAWPPMSAGGQHGEWMVGAVAALATMTGLRMKAVAGVGGVYDVSSLESVMMTQLFNPITMETMEGGVRQRKPKATVADIAPSADGWVGFAVVNRLQHWHDFCAMIGQIDWADDPTLDPPANRAERADELTPVIEAWTTAQTTAEIVELATLMRIPATEVGNGQTIPQMDHFAQAGFYETNPVDGFLQPTPPFRFNPPLPVQQARPAPPVGSPIRTVDRPSGPSLDPVDAQAQRPTLPFEGIRIVDFTSFWAGPFLTHIMGLFGADVIHVESITRPDGARMMGYRPTTESDWIEWSPFFQATNTNKRGITLNMSKPEGLDLAHRLVAVSDVVVENYSPRVMESWGLGWDDVHRLCHDAIMVRMPAFGLSGPWRDRTGFAMTMEQVSGMAWLTGFPEHRPAALFGPCDPGAGIHAAIGLMAALERRRHTGEGCLVEAPMVATALNVAAEQVIEHSAYGTLLQRDGNHGPAAAPQNCYRCADVGDDERWISLAIADDTHWALLRDALDQPQWAAGADLATHGGRLANRDLIDTHLAEWFARHQAADVVARLWPMGVPIAEVVHPSEQKSFPQLASRQFFEMVEHPVAGQALHSTFPFVVPGQAKPVHRRPAPTLGQHNNEVLGGLLGLSADELASLTERGIIGTQLSV
jgi:crotonobetainyl-CoA:carnitine CoA-transferase CaiB-like acyl-CoA transferase